MSNNGQQSNRDEQILNQNCAWPMTDCHAAALNRSRQPGPTTSFGARGAAENWLAAMKAARMI